MRKTFSTRGHYKNTARSRVSNLWDAMLCSSKYRRSILQKKIRYHKITVQLCPQQARKSLQMCSGIKSMSYTEKQTGPFCYIYIYIYRTPKHSSTITSLPLRRATYKYKLGKLTLSTLPNHVQNSNRQNVPFQTIVKPILRTRHQILLLQKLVYIRKLSHFC